MTLRNLIRIDGAAALASGCAVLLALPWISSWTGLPPTVLGKMAAVSLGYAACSFTLSTRVAIRPFFVSALATANSLWALVCLGVIFAFDPTAFGRLYLAGEAAFVAGLAIAEWKRSHATVI